MDAVFTVVTKNYLPQARTLGDSIRDIHPNLAFYILLADETEGLINLTKERYPVIEVKDIGISEFRDMAFKYDLTEFCTAVKPFFFEYLFDRTGYQKILYFDPDIFIYSDLSMVFNILNDHFVILTPHLTQHEDSDGGTKPDEDYLRCGVFNLGFIGLNASSKGRSLLSWWKDKTQDKGYADFEDGLYVDQKWADFIPCFDDDGVCIVRHPGFNVAHWNMHQRKLSKEHGLYMINNRPLLFFHFSGFDPLNPNEISRTHGRGAVTLESRPEYRDLFVDYRKKLLGNQADSIINSFAYSKFENGVQIYGFQRRIYRKLIEQHLAYENPFSIAPQSYYRLLDANGMLIKEKNTRGEFRKSNIPGAENKLRMIKKGMLLLKKLIGIRYYHLLLKILKDLSRPEEQTFLLESLHLDLPIQFR